MTDASPVRYSHAPRAALAAAIIVVLTLTVIGQTRLYYDYAWQLMSVRDFAQGETTSPFVMRSANPADLTRDETVWTIGYPLAYNATGAALVSAGLPPAVAHRAIAATAVLLGLLGWHLVFATCTSLPPLTRAGAVLLLGLSFNGTGMLSFMMPETFLFATVPWQLWAVWHATAPETAAGRRLLLCGMLGATTGIAYTFRYLAAMHGLPLLAGMAGWLAWRRPARWRPAGLILAGTAALPVAALSTLNYLHVGAINSASHSLPWGVALHCPSLTQWLLVLTGAIQALFGSVIVFARTSDWVGRHWLELAGFPTLLLFTQWLALGPTILAASLLARFAPRDRLLWFGLAGLAGTAFGLLAAYSCSRLPQPDVRYSAGPALLLWPSLVAAGTAAARHPGRWRLAAVLVALPAVFALGFALRAHQLALFRRGPTADGGIIADGRIDPPALRAAIRARLQPESGEVVWMCFQPGVLYALGERRVFESYSGQVVNYHASRPVTLVVLRDKAHFMHPSTYENNYARLEIAGRSPDLEQGDYDVFIRHIGPGGVLHPD